LRSPEKLPIGAAIVLYTFRSALSVCGGATVVMMVFAVAKVIGTPIDNTPLREFAWEVWILSAAVWSGCIVFAWVADRKRGL